MYDRYVITDEYTTRMSIVDNYGFWINNNIMTLSRRVDNDWNLGKVICVYIDIYVDITWKLCMIHLIGTLCRPGWYIDVIRNTHLITKLYAQVEFSFIYNGNVLGIMITLCSIRGQFVFDITYIWNINWESYDGVLYLLPKRRFIALCIYACIRVRYTHVFMYLYTADEPHLTKVILGGLSYLGGDLESDQLKDNNELIFYTKYYTYNCKYFWLYIPCSNSYG